MTTTTELFNGTIKATVAEISERIFNRIDNGFHFNVVEASNLEEVIDSSGEFMKRNPVGMQMINNIIDSSEYQARYKEIGEQSYEAMQEESKKQFRADPDVSTEHALGKSLVHSNVVYAVIQKLNIFPEIDLVAVHTQARKEALAHNKDIEEIHELMGKVVHKRANYIMNNYFTSAIISEMSFKQFHKYFDAKAKVEGTQESKIGSHTIRKLLGKKGSRLTAKIVAHKVAVGELHPMQAILEMEEIGHRIISEQLVVSLAVYHYAVVNNVEVDEVDVQGVMQTL